MRRMLALLAAGLVVTACGPGQRATVDRHPPPTCSPPAGGRCASDLPWHGAIDVSPDGRRIGGVVLCGGTLRATESALRVTITFHVGRMGPGTMTCARVPVVVVLDQPLGNKTVVDAVSGRTLRVVHVAPTLF
jgi:hypothetical protein